MSEAMVSFASSNAYTEGDTLKVTDIAMSEERKNIEKVLTENKYQFNKIKRDKEYKILDEDLCAADYPDVMTHFHKDLLSSRLPEYEQKFVYRPPFYLPEERYLCFNPEKRRYTHDHILNDEWVINLRSTKEKLYGDNMFSRNECEFILKSATSDLENVQKRIEHVSCNLASDGTRLAQLQESRNHLKGILEKLKVVLKNNEDNDE